MKKVFFNVRKSSRERMWDTARQATKVCKNILPRIDQHTSLDRALDQKKNAHSLTNKFKKIARPYLPLINVQALPINSSASDLLYMWGAFPRKTHIPYVVEIDNPFVLTYYNQYAFALRRKMIEKLLHRAEYVTFMSETAKDHMCSLCNLDENHCKVLPPFMRQRSELYAPSKEETVRFLFVGLGFRRKGGPELLQAFSQLPQTNIRLTVVSPVPHEVVKAYSHDARITFVEPQPREILFSDYYPNHDVFVLPSLLETLGVVILEALSFGMGVITTDLYATPEMVKDKINGRILPHPFLEHSILNGRQVIDCVSISRTKFSKKYLESVVCYQGLSLSLTEAMAEAVVDHNKWRVQSKDLFEEKFSEEVWYGRLEEIITKPS